MRWHEVGIRGRGTGVAAGGQQGLGAGGRGAGCWGCGGWHGAGPGGRLVGFRYS